MFCQTSFSISEQVPLAPIGWNFLAKDSDKSANKEDKSHAESDCKNATEEFQQFVWGLIKASLCVLYVGKTDRKMWNIYHDKKSAK